MGLGMMFPSAAIIGAQGPGAGGYGPAIQLAGNRNNIGNPEVEPGTLAQRVVMRPIDGGSYSLGTMTNWYTCPWGWANPLGGAFFPVPIVLFALQWTDPNYLFVLKKFQFRLGGYYYGLTPGVWQFQLVRANSFVKQYDLLNQNNTPSAYGACSQTIAIGGNNRRKTLGMPWSRASGAGDSIYGDIAYSSGGGGNFANPVGTVGGGAQSYPSLGAYPSHAPGGNIVVSLNTNNYTLAGYLNPTGAITLGYCGLWNANNILDPRPFAGVTSSATQTPGSNASPQFAGNLPQGAGLNGDTLPLYDSTDSFPMVFGAYEGFIAQVTSMSYSSVPSTMAPNATGGGYYVASAIQMDWEEVPNF